MIDALRSRKAALKWRPRQKFVLTVAGQAARDEHAAEVAALPRGPSAREALERVQASWASRYTVQPVDASVLAELSADEGRPHRQLFDALEDAGVTLHAVQDAIDRLYGAGLVAPADGIPPESRGNA